MYKKVVVFYVRICFILKGCFPVGELYLVGVISHNSGRIASVYQAILEIFYLSLKFGLRGISP